jgi:hypothetical protein
LGQGDGGLGLGEAAARTTGTEEAGRQQTSLSIDGTLPLLVQSELLLLSDQ